jgi:hypothetical protein
LKTVVGRTWPKPWPSKKIPTGCPRVGTPGTMVEVAGAGADEEEEERAAFDV